MLNINQDEILDLIRSKDCFEGYTNDGALYIKVEEYVPYICTAIHDGHKFRKELEATCNLSDIERYHEEDPFTGEMIKTFPIVMIPQDSRYEYDLNRGPEEFVHINAWGTEVWKRKLSDSELKESKRKYDQFYTICYSLIESLISIHAKCILFDVHSYNILDRDYVDPPMFNIGTKNVDVKRYRKTVDKWIDTLSKIDIKGHSNVVRENDVFWGKGYLAESIHNKYPDCLVLPTEVKKIYANELKPEPYEDIIADIRNGFKPAIDATLKIFVR